MVKKSFTVAVITFLFTLPTVAQDSLTHAFRFNPVRLFAGTFELEYEQQLGDQFTVSFMGLGTYAADNGLGGWYLNLQNVGKGLNEEGVSYTPQTLTGYGGIIQPRYYLTPGFDEPKGIYVGANFLYRKLWMKAQLNSNQKATQVQSEISSELSVFSVGLLIGGQLPVAEDLFVVDGYLGPTMRLSSYAREEGLAQLTHWTAVDHTGITFHMGLSIGLVR